MSTTCIPPARHIRTDDIPEEYRDIVDAIGMEAFVHLTLLCGGQSLYIPKRESLERNARDRDIRARFNGTFQMVCSVGQILGQVLAGVCSQFAQERTIILCAMALNMAAIYGIVWPGRQHVKKVYNRQA